MEVLRSDSLILADTLFIEYDILVNDVILGSYMFEVEDDDFGYLCPPESGPPCSAASCSFDTVSGTCNPDNCGCYGESIEMLTVALVLSPGDVVKVDFDPADMIAETNEVNNVSQATVASVVPTVSEWGLLTIVGLVVGMGLYVLRKRKARKALAT
jgi:hypothetical protein